MNITSKRNNSPGLNNVKAKDKEDIKAESRTVFTLNDGIRLLQTNKNIPIENIFKQPNIIPRKSNYNQNAKAKRSGDNITLNINSIKGKSIFNNSILDNVLGVVDMNNEFSLKKYTDNIELLYQERENRKNVNQRPQEDKTSHIFNSSKEVIDDGYFKSLLLNENDYKAVSSEPFKMNKTKDCSLQDELYNRDSIPLLTIDFNNQKNYYNKNIKILSDINSFKCPNHHNHNYFNTKLLKGNKNSDLHLPVNINENDCKIVLNKDLANSPGKSSSNIKSKSNKKIFLNTCSNYNPNLSNKKLSNDQKTYFSNNDSVVLNSSKINKNKKINITANNVEKEFNAYLHNKELKFELYRRNKLLNFQSKDFTGTISNFNVKAPNQLNVNDYKPNSFDKNSDLKLISNTIYDCNKHNAIEASTQTKFNITNITEDRIPLSRLEVKDNIFDSNNFIVKLENPYLFNKKSYKDTSLIQDKVKESLSQGKNLKSSLIEKHLYLKNNTIFDSASKEYNNSISKNSNNKEGINLLKDNKSVLNNRKETNEKLKSLSFNNKKNPLNYFYMLNLNISKFFTPSNNLVMTEKSKINIGIQNTLNSPGFYDSSKSKIIEKIGEDSDFHKEIFQNSKILCENFMYSNRNLKRSPTSQGPQQNTSKSKKFERIKFSKNIKM